MLGVVPDPWKLVNINRCCDHERHPGWMCPIAVQCELTSVGIRTHTLRSHLHKTDHFACAKRDNSASVVRTATCDADLGRYSRERSQERSLHKERSGRTERPFVGTLTKKYTGRNVQTPAPRRAHPLVLLMLHFQPERDTFPPLSTTHHLQVTRVPRLFTAPPGVLLPSVAEH